jgi:hypothetical protein
LATWLAGDNSNFAPNPDFHSGYFHAGRGRSLDRAPYVTLAKGIRTAAHEWRDLRVSPNGFYDRQLTVLVAPRRLDDLGVLHRDDLAVGC